MTPAPASEPSAASMEASKALLVAFRYLSSRSGVGMRDLPDHLVEALAPEVALALDAAVQGERERCAKVCEAIAVKERALMGFTTPAALQSQVCAAAIREGRTP